MPKYTATICFQAEDADEARTALEDLGTGKVTIMEGPDEIEVESPEDEEEDEEEK